MPVHSFIHLSIHPPALRRQKLCTADWLIAVVVVALLRQVQCAPARPRTQMDLGSRATSSLLVAVVDGSRPTNITKTRQRERRLPLCSAVFVPRLQYLDSFTQRSRSWQQKISYSHTLAEGGESNREVFLL